MKHWICVLAVTLSVAGAAMAAPHEQAHGNAGVSAATALRQDMRKLWTDHVVWTRDYIVAAVGDQPDASRGATRLLKNQEDIGSPVAAYLRQSRRRPAHGAAQGAHHDRRRPDQGGEGRRQGRAAAGRHEVAAERRGDRRLPQQGQPELAARHARRHDEETPVDDDGRSRRATDQELGRGHPRVRRRLRAHSHHVGRVERRHHQAVPGEVRGPNRRRDTEPSPVLCTLRGEFQREIAYDRDRVREPPEIPSEIEEFRDERWRREGARQVSTAHEAERFIEQVGFASCLTDSRRPGPSLYIAVCGRRDAVMPRNVQKDEEASSAWLLKDEIIRRGNIYYAKLARGKATFIAPRMVPYLQRDLGHAADRKRSRGSAAMR